MIGFYAAQATRAAAPIPIGDALIFPLTYDEMDAAHEVTLQRTGGSGPHVTPSGFEGDGYGARYTTDEIPSWVSGSFSLQATYATVPVPRVRSAADTAVHLGGASPATRKLALAVTPDPRLPVTMDAGVVSVVSGGNTQRLCRSGWRYEARVPSLTVNGFTAIPQALLHMGDGTLLLSVHLQDTESVVYRIRLEDGAVVGQFSFGTTTHRHVSSLARRANGDVWAIDYETANILHLDLAASFSNGVATILHTYEALSPAGAIEFMDYGEDEILLICNYDLTDDTPLYAFDAESELAFTKMDQSRRIKYFQVQRRVQGICVRDGNLLLSRNQYPSDVGGFIFEMDIRGALDNLPDGSRIDTAVNNTAYIARVLPGPSQYVEDITVDPHTGRLFCGSEGEQAVGDVPGFMGVWSSDLDGQPEENTYVLAYGGPGDLTVRINGYEFVSLPWTLPSESSVLSIGGPPDATPGFTNGWALGFVRNVALADGILSPEASAQIASGDYEPNSLTTYDLVLDNPGAEAGNTAGWSNEVGSLAVRSANPLPYEGAFYFSAGPNVTTIARQRLDLLAQGVPEVALNTGQSWAKIRWQQSAYSDQDPGGMGLRSLTAGDVPIETEYSGLAWTPFGGGAGGPWYWFPRAFPMALDPAARKLDAIYNAGPRTSGTNNDHYVDLVSVTVYAP